MARRQYGAYGFELSHPAKVLFPDCGLSKADLLTYHERIADAMLPHLRDRPLTLQRFPDGIEGEGFYQKAAPSHWPAWIERTRVATAEGPQEQIVCGNRATLAYLAQLACVTPHVWLSRRDLPRRPDLLVFDLDPESGRFADARWAALRCRELLAGSGLPSYLKLSGSRGLHVTVPLRRDRDFDEVRDFARGVAELLAARHPRRLTVEQRIAKRAGRVYLDVARNAYAQTVVAPYAVRARRGAPVAAPITWEELEGGIEPRSVTTRTVFDLLERRGDPWRGMLRRARGLAGAEGALARLVDR